MYAHYCLHNFHWLPSFFLDLEENEKAFVIASIDFDAEQKKREQQKLKIK